MQPLQNITATTGRTGEAMVCLDLIRRGYDAAVSPFPGSPYDILVDLGKDGVLRVQVKTTREPRWELKGDRPSNKSRGAFRYCFQFDTERYRQARIDLFAFVALDTPAIYYLPASAVKTKTSRKQFGVKTFHMDAAASWTKFLTAWVFE